MLYEGEILCDNRDCPNLGRAVNGIVINAKDIDEFHLCWDCIKKAKKEIWLGIIDPPQKNENKLIKFPQYPDSY